MRSLIPLSLAAAAVLLTACHTHGGYLSSDPELVYGPGVVEFPEAERVYLPMYRRAAAASSIGVHTAGVQMARAARPPQATLVAAPPRAGYVPAGHPPVAPTAALPPGQPQGGVQVGAHLPAPGTHTVRVYDHAGPAPLPPVPAGARVNIHGGHGGHAGAQIGIHPR